jgi:hypothetical protein
MSAAGISLKALRRSREYSQTLQRDSSRFESGRPDLHNIKSPQALTGLWGLLFMPSYKG